MQTLTLVYNIEVTEVLYARVCNTTDSVQMSVKLKFSENAVKPQTGIEYTKVIIDLWDDLTNTFTEILKERGFKCVEVHPFHLF